MVGKMMACQSQLLVHCLGLFSGCGWSRGGLFPFVWDCLGCCWKKKYGVNLLLICLYVPPLKGFRQILVTSTTTFYLPAKKRRLGTNPKHVLWECALPVEGVYFFVLALYFSSMIFSFWFGNGVFTAV